MIQLIKFCDKLLGSANNSIVGYIEDEREAINYCEERNKLEEKKHAKNNEYRKMDYYYCNCKEIYQEGKTPCQT